MEEKIDMNGIFKYLVTTLFSVIGFFLITSFNDMKNNLATLNTSVTQLNLDIVKLKSEMLSEAKVREICVQEILRYKHANPTLQKILND